MLNDFVTNYKTKQDALDLRKKELLEKFEPFREQLVDELRSFLENAVKSNVQNVSKLMTMKTHSELKEFGFRLNDMEFVIISTNKVLFRSGDGSILEAKIFVYEGDDENEIPFFEIGLRGPTANNRYIVSASWFCKGERKLINDISLSDASAGTIASDLVTHICQYQPSWVDQPKRRMASSIGAKGLMGFKKPE